ncbi:Methyltransferase type 12 [Acidimicrobium ferrooxidans DSM 10331]|uniref:Methyltransferase type 12 n=1 Tax=Acidimicrobium ferrooxidans (strain DSM 10331 / JCM 15462 / NBRC 103882 / ICP) TaxID=525909 RepID=C7M072_ACIFD|nr:methyltransferase domain-containing protein [Acidimicrobium ferrooxidans]ACU54380.1 Methyltransferase type 12 [Acidimicrobium ferrooxidans DSM 10331]
MSTAWTFGAAALRYDTLRPPYPAATFSTLERAIGSYEGSRVVEVGAGTGIATQGLVAAGADVLALEPDPGMGRILRRRLPTVRMVPARLEDVDLEGVHLLVGFQSLHWIPVRALWRAARRALAPGGVLAGVWQLATLSDVRAAHAIGEVLARFGVERSRGSDQRVSDTIEALSDQAVHGFAPAMRCELPWHTQRSATSFAGLLATMSDLLALGHEGADCEAQLAEALRPYEPIDVRYDCVVIMRQRMP